MFENIKKSAEEKHMKLWVLKNPDYYALLHVVDDSTYYLKAFTVSEFVDVAGMLEKSGISYDSALDNEEVYNNIRNIMVNHIVDPENTEPEHTPLFDCPQRMDDVVGREHVLELFKHMLTYSVHHIQSKPINFMKRMWYSFLMNIDMNLLFIGVFVATWIFLSTR